MNKPQEQGFICNLCGEELFSWNKNVHIHRIKNKPKDIQRVCLWCGHLLGTGVSCEDCQDATQGAAQP
jgi:hypothetical protein